VNCTVYMSMLDRSELLMWIFCLQSQKVVVDIDTAVVIDGVICRLGLNLEVSIVVVRSIR
jgi:hypothetical protein